MIQRCAFKGDESVLDLDCGEGKYTHVIAKKIPEGTVVGTDKSKEMIRHAKEIFAGKNIEYVVADAENMALHRKFDYILSLYCFHWLKDFSRALDCISDHLKKEGVLYALLLERVPELWLSLEELIKQEKWAGYFIHFTHSYGTYTQEICETHFQQSNFSSYKITRFEECLTFDKPQSLIDPLAAWLPHYSHLPKALGDKFMNELLEIYLCHKPKENGEIIYKNNALFIEAHA